MVQLKGRGMVMADLAVVAIFLVLADLMAWSVSALAKLVDRT